MRPVSGTSAGGGFGVFIGWIRRGVWDYWEIIFLNVKTPISLSVQKTKLNTNKNPPVDVLAGFLMGGGFSKWADLAAKRLLS